MIIQLLHTYLLIISRFVLLIIDSPFIMES